MKKLLLVTFMLAFGFSLQACNMTELHQPQEQDQKNKKSKCILDNLHTGECEMYSDEKMKVQNPFL